jgi:YVTN family beta-propeller protein
MELKLLGPVEATHEGQRIPLGAAKQRAVLAMLALRPSASMPVEALIDGLWGEVPPASAPKMVQLYVSQLRRLLEGTDAEIVTRGRGYELRIAGDAVDAVQFERLLEAGDARAALDLWPNGTGALADVSGEPFATLEIRRLEELRLRAAELAADADLAAGRHAEVAGRLEPLAREHPLREGLHERRMLALYRSGRQGEALAAYREARESLVEQIGVEPGPALRELHERILRQDPSLDAAGSEPASPRTAPEPAALAARPQARHRLVVIAAAALALGVAAFVFTRLAGDDSLPGIDEGAVGVVDGDGAITSQYRLGPEPGAIASGAGSTWVAHPAAGTVSRIRRDENRVDTIDVGDAPASLTFAAGSLWVGGGSDGTVARIDATTNRVEQRVTVGNGLRGLAGGFGAVWAAAGVDGTVARIDPRSGRVTARAVVGGHPAALAVGAGSVWAVAEDAGSVVRIDPRTATSVQAIPVGNGPSAVAFADGAAWVANQHDGTVSRIDPATDRVSHTLPAGPAPLALAAVAGGLWIGDAGGEIRRLDLRSREIGATVRTHSTPAALAAIEGDLWAAGAPSLRSHRGGTLRVSLGGTVDVDPATGAAVAPFMELVYESLVEHRRTGGGAAVQIVPGLAAAVPSPADGGRRYTFRLRRGLRFSDGTPVRAGHFRASLERTLRATTEVLAFFESIRGVAGCSPRRCDLSPGIHADDAGGTIELRLRRPDPELLYHLSLPVAGMVGPSRSEPVGTGPYRVTAGRPEVTLERNPHFRPRLPGGRRDGFPDRIVHQPIQSAEDGASAVERGTLDLYLPGPFAPAEVSALQSRAGGRLGSEPRAGTVLAFLNVQASPLDDVRVRTAINLSVDRGHVVRETGLASIQCQLLPPGMLGYRPVCPFTAAPTRAEAWSGPDRDRARGLVSASGTAGAAIAVFAAPERRHVGRHLVAALRDLGFRSRLKELAHDGEVFEAAMAADAGAFIAVTAWFAQNPAPARFLRDLVGCEATANLARFCDRALDRAIDRAEELGDAPGDAWERIERRIASAAPVVPLYTLRFPTAVSPRVGNLQYRPLSGVLLDQVWVR